MLKYMLRRYQRPNMPPSCGVCIAAHGFGVSSTLSGNEAAPARTFKLWYLWLRHTKDKEIRVLKRVKEPKREVCRHETPRLKARPTGSKEDVLRFKQNLCLRIGVEAAERASEGPCIGGRRKSELMRSSLTLLEFKICTVKWVRFHPFKMSPELAPSLHYHSLQGIHLLCVSPGKWWFLESGHYRLK